MPAEQLAQLFEVLEGGAQVAGEVVQFPVDAAGAAAETALAGEGISTSVQLGNGVAAEVSQLTVVEGGATTTTGVGLLAMDVGVAGAAIAPALGILAGVGLYNLAPEFWTNVSNSLVAAGQTIGGKVRAFLDGNTKQAYLSEETIEIFKNAFIEAGLFNVTYNVDTPDSAKENVESSYLNKLPFPIILDGKAIRTSDLTLRTGLDSVTSSTSPVYSCYFTGIPYTSGSSTLWISGLVVCSADPFTCVYYNSGSRSESPSRAVSIFGLTFHFAGFYGSEFVSKNYTYVNNYNVNLDYNSGFDPYKIAVRIAYLIISSTITKTGNVQQDAVLPDNKPISETYPGWHSHSEDCPCNPELKMYPIEIPANNPDANQGQAQNPDPDPDPGPWLDWLTNNLPQPDPNPDLTPEPVPEPDPDPQPVPEPVPGGGTNPIPPDPPDPNPVPPTPPIPVVPVLPATVDSNAMFTVYSPSLSQLNSFGGWLWNSSIIEQILRMWQNPLDGIIAFMKVYAVPTTGRNANIQVGYLDSGVSAPVVTSQFVTVDCGTVEVNERKHNATDYTPYVSLHLYLPFIGIVELDPDEFMDGTISVKYTIDVYTGTCLAEVKCTRSIDMPNATILYTFSGNASQQLPLTSANFAGALSSLVSAVGGGIMIASGGAVGGIAGAAALGHSLTHEMVHVGHSGALSSNAGIMASRKPYLIISRRHAYDANNYAVEYGYPANKAVYLGNCSGFTRVKAGHLKCKADAVEKEEIMALLEKGVLL